MKKIRIRDLKAHLTERLRQVQEERKTLTVLDHGEPVAQIVPFSVDRPELRIHPPNPKAPALRDVPLPDPLDFKGDVMEFLLEERQGDR